MAQGVRGTRGDARLLLRVDRVELRLEEREVAVRLHVLRVLRRQLLIRQG